MKHLLKALALGMIAIYFLSGCSTWDMRPVPGRDVYLNGMNERHVPTALEKQIMKSKQVDYDLEVEVVGVSQAEVK